MKRRTFLLAVAAAPAAPYLPALKALTPVGVFAHARMLINAGHVGAAVLFLRKAARVDKGVLAGREWVDFCLDPRYGRAIIDFFAKEKQ